MRQVKQACEVTFLAEGQEQTGSQAYVPPDLKHDKALKMALDLLHLVRPASYARKIPSRIKRQVRLQRRADRVRRGVGFDKGAINTGA